jgi:(p)ppGpp synthase/HD superfamily hydrolase
MAELQIAELIARYAHHGQKEKLTGDDYIHHVERVVAKVEGNEAKTVAWLHDVMEDSGLLYSDLERAGISDKTVEAVFLLTRVPSETYAEYIFRLRASGNALAIYVKLADLEDHLRPGCPEGLRHRYEVALGILEAAS